MCNGTLGAQSNVGGHAEKRGGRVTEDLESNMEDPQPRGGGLASIMSIMQRLKVTSEVHGKMVR